MREDMARTHRTGRIISIVTRMVIGFGLIAAAGGIYQLLWQTRPQPAQVQGEQTLPRVTVMQPHPVPVSRRYTGYGTAEAMDSVDVPARVTATVQQVPDAILVGNAIAKGQLLVRLDDSDFVQQLEMATQQMEQINADLELLDVEKKSLERRLEIVEEDVALAEAEYERVRDARMQGAATPRELDQARQAVLQADRARVELREQLERLTPRRMRLESQLEQQKSNRKLAQLNVDRCTVESPIAGVLQAVDVEPGESLTPGQRIARVVDLSRIEVPLRLPAQARREIGVGDEVTLSSTGTEALTWRAKARRIAPENERSTRTIAVYAEVRQDPTSPNLLAPGMFVAGTAMSAQHTQRWVVPRRSLRGEEIMVVKNNMVSTRPVRVDFHIQEKFPQLGLSDEQWAVLAEPLEADALVVLDAGRKLAEGSSVSPVVVNGGGPDAAVTARDGTMHQPERTP